MDGFFNYFDSQNKQNSHTNDFGIYEDHPDLDPDPDENDLKKLIYQRMMNPSYRYRLNGRLTYTEPVSKYSQVSLGYRTSYNYQQSDKKTYRTGEDYGITGLLPDPLLSNAYTRAAIRCTLSAPASIFSGPQYFRCERLLSAFEPFRSEVIPWLRRDQARLQQCDLFYGGTVQPEPGEYAANVPALYTDNPEVTQLQNVYDVSDAQYITRGNPDLQPSYSHNLSMHYVNSMRRRAVLLC